MRVMLQFRFPPETGNDLIRSGKIGQLFESILGDLKPEAAYFFPDGGDRAGLIVFDMQQSKEVALACERFFLGFGAKVELTPVMAPEDLQQALSGVEEVVKKYG